MSRIKELVREAREHVSFIKTPEPKPPTRSRGRLSNYGFIFTIAVGYYVIKGFGGGLLTQSPMVWILALGFIAYSILLYIRHAYSVDDFSDRVLTRFWPMPRKAMMHENIASYQLVEKAGQTTVVLTGSDGKDLAINVNTTHSPNPFLFLAIFEAARLDPITFEGRFKRLRTAFPLDVNRAEVDYISGLNAALYRENFS